MTASIKLYKVVGSDGSAIHGGSGTWSLPTGDQPGEWMPPVDGPVIRCTNGYHLTDNPIEWWQLGARVFEAEPDKKVSSKALVENKVAIRSARLLREIDWSEFQVFGAGSHKVAVGRAIAYDSAQVTAYNSAQVTSTAYHANDATVELSGDAVHIDRRNRALILRARGKELVA